MQNLELIQNLLRLDYSLIYIFIYLLNIQNLILFLYANIFIKLFKAKETIDF
jgi:hypothetical protein